jgi:Flp pilus assembly protein TadD
LVVSLVSVSISALERLGKHEQARAALRTALKLSPDGASANKTRERLEALE